MVTAINQPHFCKALSEPVDQARNKALALQSARA
jgi:hypothetical protein